MFQAYYIDQLEWHIAKVSLNKKSIGFYLDAHFHTPSSQYSQFMVDLKKEPLDCLKVATQQTMDELAKKYSDGHNYINT